MWLTIKAYKKYISGLALLLASCQPPQKALVQFQGNALGTTYSIQYGQEGPKAAVFQTALDSILTVMNQSMSTYWPNSTISTINNGAVNVVIDSHFEAVFNKATQVWKATDSLFDPTVGNFVEAYGFGNKENLNVLNAQQRDSILAFTGWHLVQLKKNPQPVIEKADPRVGLNFNALAKGYTIDVIGWWLENHGVKNYIVEIGGELRARGNRPGKQRPWRVGIDNPNNRKENYTQTLPLSNRSLATSGNYRKFNIDPNTGNKYVHTINPKTGKAEASTVLSASVLAPDCMTADAWATALMLLSPALGLEKINANPNLEAYWIIADGATTTEVFSEGWPME